MTCVFILFPVHIRSFGQQHIFIHTPAADLWLSSRARVFLNRRHKKRKLHYGTLNIKNLEICHRTRRQNNTNDKCVIAVQCAEQSCGVLCYDTRQTITCLPQSQHLLFYFHSNTYMYQYIHSISTSMKQTTTTKKTCILL